MHLFDACVIGAGPAGITAALELAERGLTVVLVESGAENNDPAAQRLSDAKITIAGSHSVMSEAVRRGLGGTSALWGGRCVPLDALDFEQRDFIPMSGWPLKASDLQPYYQRACEILGVGNANFEVKSCTSLATKDHALSSLFDDTETIRAIQLERWSGEPNLWRAYKDRLAAHSCITVLSNMTCVGFRHAKPGEAVVEALVRSTAAAQTELHYIKAAVFILACGGVESTRLVLNTINDPLGLKLDSVRLVGRYYMGHPSGKVADIELFGDPKKTLYGFERDGGVFVRRRITIQPETLSKEKLFNIAFWLDHAPLPDWRHGSGVLSAAYLALNTPWLGTLLANPATRNRVAGNGAVVHRPHVLNCLRSPIGTVYYSALFFYQRYIAKPRLPGFFTFNGSNRYALHYHAEQMPNWDSTIKLANEVDAHGMRKAQISLKWSPQDIESIIRAHEVLDKSLQKNGIGRLSYRYPAEDLEKAVREQAVDGFHQIGTLRMAADSSHGVTDPYGRLYGTTNCYVASSAVFPTSGQANPTLALVALTVRQARHIGASLLNPKFKAAAGVTTSRPAPLGFECAPVTGKVATGAVHHGRL